MQSAPRTPAISPTESASKNRALKPLRPSPDDLAAVRYSISKDIEGLAHASGEDANAMGTKEFSTLIGEALSDRSSPDTLLPSGVCARCASVSPVRQSTPLRTSPAERKVLDDIAMKLGPILDNKDAPLLHSVLRTIFNRLSTAQVKLVPTNAVSINHIHIVDSPVVNAFVYALKDDGVRRSSNLVFITTGMLKRMLDKDPALLKEGLIRIAGVVAHELAHPLDALDEEGILSHCGAKIGSQAREVRADSEGVMIAKEAGFPAECVYKALQRLFAGAPSGSTLSSLTSTHPQNGLRLGMQRIHLTLDRSAKGSLAPRFPNEVPLGLLNELAGIDKAGALRRFVPITNLSEALSRLQKVADEKRDMNYRNLEFNRLLLAVDDLVAEKGELTDTDFALFTDIAKLVARKDSPKILDRPGMKDLFTEGNHSTEFLAYPSHESFMKKIAAFNSSRYLEWVKANYYTEKARHYFHITDNLNTLAKVLPSKHIFALFGDRIAEDLPAAFRTHMETDSRHIYDSSIADGHSVDFKVRLATFFHRRVLPGLTPEQRMAFCVANASRKYSYVLPQTDEAESPHYSLGILKQHGLLMGDARLKTLQTDYRAAMQSIWDQRGHLGVLEMIKRHAWTDWDSLFSTLGIDRQLGHGQLRQAVKAFTKTPAYVEMLRTIRDSNFKAFGRRIGLGKFNYEAYWLDDTLGPYLSGDFNDILRADPDLLAFARKSFASTFYKSRPQAFRRVYGRRFTAALAAAPGGMTLRQIQELHRGLMDTLAGDSSLIDIPIDIQAAAIDRSGWPAEMKRQLLKDMFLKGDNRIGEWLILRNADKFKPVIRVLIKNQVVCSTQDLLSQLVAKDTFLGNASFSGYTSVIGHLKNELLADLDAALAGTKTDSEKAAVLLRFLETVVDPGNGKYDDTALINTVELREIKTKVAALASGLDIPFIDDLRLFRHLTGSGAVPATDVFFQKNLEPAFNEAAAEAAGLGLPAVLEQGRIAGTNLQLTLTRQVLEPEVKRITAAPPDPEALNRLIETLNAYVRHGSLKKDEYLEELAWRLELSGRELRSFIEDEKSYNWRKANPILLRLGSSLSAEISKLPPEARRAFIRFLLEPEGRELPGAIVKELRRNLYAAAKGTHESPEKVKFKVERDANLIKLEIEAALIDASPFERIPLFEMLLSAGGTALQKAHDFPHNITREFLNYQENSKEEMMLDAYLAIIPSHERTVSLAYLLSQAGQNKSSVNSIFEMFQTVGVKFAQLSSTWKLFGEEVARQTKKLKNAARPMTRAEIEDVMLRELTPEEFSRIRLKKVIGSASLKTVVLVELPDGREVVMLVRRPHAAEQIESNLTLGQEFLRALNRLGMTAVSAQFDAVLDAVRRQLAEELQLTREAKQLTLAKEFYDGLNESMAGQLQGWRFEVPALVPGFQVRNTILFMTKATGVAYDKLSPSNQAQAGPLIDESSLQLLFRQGWFDADRHTGNQLIDTERKVIHPFDFGQATEFSKTTFWKTDDRYELSQFLRALDTGDVESLLRHGRAMSSAGSPNDMRALHLEIKKILSGDGSLADQLIALVTAFADQGQPLDGKFTFGAFKGLMTLYGESYIPEAGFRQLLRREIVRLLRKKFPRVFWDDRHTVAARP